ncbi:hypothetical protein HK100_006481 [Physocladia obscura]|uniref:Uncharacterized protein n=1 Tax=Physocladia obscura TaxID=109957 RepID=A0AAD5T7Y6_9FUNG|nr:hypothetical protein HK100_006481 [Physocladia obscura]
MKGRKDIELLLDGLESYEIPLEIFLDKTEHIDYQSSSGTNALNWPDVKFLNSIIADIGSVSPIMRLSVLVISTAYQIAKAPENHRSDIRDLAKRFTNLVTDIDALQETEAAMFDKSPKSKKLLVDRIEELLNCLIIAAEVYIQAKFTLLSAIMEKSKVENALASLQMADNMLLSAIIKVNLVGGSEMDANVTKTLAKANEILDHLKKDNNSFTINSEQGIIYEATQKAQEIKNSGYLNNTYSYFKFNNLVTNSNAELKEVGSASTKYYSITANTIVFNSSCTHVLMVFRCPHLREHNLVTCDDNILEKYGSFQYKGCLGTPGTFFDAKRDTNNEDKCPNYVRFAERQFKETIIPLENEYSYDMGSLYFIGPQFNNFRDIRWHTSKP